MTLRSDGKFEEKLTCRLKNDMKNVENFHQSTQKRHNWHFDEILCQKQKMYELKIYRGVMCRENEERFKN